MVLFSLEIFSSTFNVLYTFATNSWTDGMQLLHLAAYIQCLANIEIWFWKSVKLKLPTNIQCFSMLIIFPVFVNHHFSTSLQKISCITERRLIWHCFNVHTAPVGTGRCDDVEFDIASTFIQRLSEQNVIATLHWRCFSVHTKLVVMGRCSDVELA